MDPVVVAMRQGNARPALEALRVLDGPAAATNRVWVLGRWKELFKNQPADDPDNLTIVTAMFSEGLNC